MGGFVEGSRFKVQVLMGIECYFFFFFLLKKKIPRKNGSLRPRLSTAAVEGFVGGWRFKFQWGQNLPSKKNPKKESFTCITNQVFVVMSFFIVFSVDLNFPLSS